MSSASGTGARPAQPETGALGLGKPHEDQENLDSHASAPSRDADRPPLQALPQARLPPMQRPRLKLPGSLNLTKKLGPPARKAGRASEYATGEHSEAALPGEIRRL
jgi:hypothetical protein